MKTAELISTKISATHAVQNHYRMIPPYEGNDCVVISALPCAFDTGRPETYIFPADSDGKILSYGELDGSRRGVCDHNVILSEIGYRTKTKNKNPFLANDETIHLLS